jgi:probable phosphoglycerate mutase
VTRLVLVRHGHVLGIEPARFRGGLNLELTERGLREAQLTADCIARRWQPAVVYTSPRQRCTVTARLIAQACAVSYQEMEGLRDLDYGLWQNKTHDEVRTAYPTQYGQWRNAPHMLKFPDGDSLQQLSARVVETLRLILDAHPDATVVVVAHDSSNRVLLLHALGLSLASYWRINQDPCGVSEIHADVEGLSVRCMNDTAHLPGYS